MGLLDDAEDIHEIPKHLFTTLYGPPGVGKTICSARTANNTLIFAGEKSYVSLSQFPEIRAKAIPSQGYDHLTRIIQELYNDPRDYDHFMIDTVDDLVRRKLKEQRQKIKFNRHEATNDISSLEDYNLLNNHMADLTARLAMLPISVTVISHDRLPDPKNYGKGDRLLRPSLPFKVFESFNGYANVVGYMHMRKMKVQEDGKEATRLRRVIALQSNDEYEAKNHLKLPAIVTDEKFIETVRNWKGI
jgi:hypothetical protein